MGPSRRRLDGLVDEMADLRAIVPPTTPEPLVVLPLHPQNCRKVRTSLSSSSYSPILLYPDLTL